MFLDEDSDEPESESEARELLVEIDLDLSAQANARKYYVQKKAAGTKEPNCICLHCHNPPFLRFYKCAIFFHDLQGHNISFD